MLVLVRVGNKKRPGPKVPHCIRRLERYDNQTKKLINPLQNQFM